MPGLYVHIPFCKQKCLYCDFPSYAGAEDRIEAYCAALAQEITALAPEFRMPFDTVFVGGGTPSLLPEHSIAELFEALFRSFSITQNAEISMECNPGTADGRKLAAMRKAGVNRLSLGLQSMDDTLLLRIGRIHNRETFLRSYDAALNAGFTNINVDVMHGLPGQSVDAYMDTLYQLTALSPSHISAYSLILEEGTKLYEAVQNNKEHLPTEDETANMQDAGIAFLAQNGYARYEISNFAKPGQECRHNLNYWQNGSYLGLGAAAHSAWRLDGAWRRWSNPSALTDYADMAKAPLFQRDLQQIPPAEERFESVMLALRTIRGLDLAAFHARFQTSFEACYPEAIKTLYRRNWLQIKNGFAALSPQGLDMQNTALLAFLPD